KDSAIARLSSPTVSIDLVISDIFILLFNQNGASRAIFLSFFCDTYPQVENFLQADIGSKH
ncbi:MAG: hypothetical protein WCJ12_09125, partial [Burkholderiaceae bacterium]